MSAPIVESPRPEIGGSHIVAVSIAKAELEGNSSYASELDDVETLLVEIVAGRLQTYSPESERVINVERIGRVADYAKAMQKLAPDGVTRSQFVAIETEIRGWLVSTKQEVSE